MRPARLFFILIAPFLAALAHAADLVVIVNPASGVHSLSTNQALDIFLGRYRKLPNGIDALPIDLSNTAPERKAFYLVLAHKDPADMSSYWARLVFSGQTTPPLPVADAHAAVELVAGNKNAVAYVDRSAVDNRVRVVLDLKP